MEAVGVVTLIGHTLYHAKLGGIQTAEAIAQVFARSAVEAEPVAGFVFPAIHRVAQTLDDSDAFRTQRLTVVDMLVAKQGVNGFVDPDIAQRDRSAAVFEDLRHIVVSFQTHAAGPFHIQNRGDTGFDPFQTGDTGHQCFTRQQQALVQQRPEGGLIAFGFQRDARQVQADHAQIVTPVVDLLAVFIFVHTKEAAAAHRGFERTGDFHHLVIVQNVRVHALARAL